MLRTRAGAAAIRAGVHYEAFLRFHHSRCWTLLTGCDSQMRRWRRDEQSDRQRLAPDRAASAARIAHVFWHGPDRIVDDRPVLVLVNGWTASGLLWPSDLVEQLERSFNVVRIDNRGSGYSRTARAPFTLAHLADDVRDVLRAIEAQSATIVGLSMGGMIAQELAIRHPQMVERLVLCGTRPPAPVGIAPARSVLHAVTSAPRAGEGIREFLERTWGTVVAADFRGRDADGMRELIDRLGERPTPRAGVNNQMRAIAGWSGASRLARIEAPTVVIHGADDPLIPVGNGMRLAQLIPNARYVELPGVGHIVPFEAPDALLAAIAST
jgi:3-oxoadipate enol-lactonase